MDISRRAAAALLCTTPRLALAVPAPTPVAPPLRVVASFSILADMLREIGGAAVQVSALVGPDADAHVFEPRPADARQLAQADLVVVNGLGFEGWIDRLVHTSGYRGPVVVASQAVVPRRLGAAPDPHAWQDLGHAQRYVQTLADALAAARPAQAALFRARAAQYGARLAALDAEIRRTLAAVPRERRRIITSHDAFGYFAAAYGIEFLAAQGRNTDSEPSAADVARLIDQIRAQRVAAVFVENISDPRLVERIAREGRVRVGGRLYSDALSPPGTEADTYLKMFAHNAQAILVALKPGSGR
jgi:zinc/manganese transport system substrate-binding protein